VRNEGRGGDVRNQLNPPVWAINGYPIVPPRIAERTEPELGMMDWDSPSPDGPAGLERARVLHAEELGYAVGGEAVSMGGTGHAQEGQQGEYWRCGSSTWPTPPLAPLPASAKLLTASASSPVFLPSWEPPCP